MTSLLLNDYHSLVHKHFGLNGVKGLIISSAQLWFELKITYYSNKDVVQLLVLDYFFLTSCPGWPATLK